MLGTYTSGKKLAILLWLQYTLQLMYWSTKMEKIGTNMWAGKYL